MTLQRVFQIGVSPHKHEGGYDCLSSFEYDPEVQFDQIREKRTLLHVNTCCITDAVGDYMLCIPVYMCLTVRFAWGSNHRALEY